MTSLETTGRQSFGACVASVDRASYADVRELDSFVALLHGQERNVSRYSPPQRGQAMCWRRRTHVSAKCKSAETMPS